MANFPNWDSRNQVWWQWAIIPGHGRSRIATVSASLGSCLVVSWECGIAVLCWGQVTVLILYAVSCWLHFPGVGNLNSLIQKALDFQENLPNFPATQYQKVSQFLWSSSLDISSVTVILSFKFLLLLPLLLPLLPILLLTPLRLLPSPPWPFLYWNRLSQYSSDLASSYFTLLCARILEMRRYIHVSSTEFLQHLIAMNLCVIDVILNFSACVLRSITYPKVDN